MKLSNIVPWGRSLAEYQAMFSLSDHDLEKTILGCGDGPASFNAELSQKGGTVVSVDPIYKFSAMDIRSRIKQAYSQVLEQVSLHKEDFVWKTIPSVEALGQIRMNAMELFLEDYGQVKTNHRYIAASLPQLPFDDKSFEIALCSHYLFLYSNHANLEHHLSSMKELCRVANEVRVYPLLSITDNQESPHLTTVISKMNAEGIHVSLNEVDYEFQKGANKMLVAKTG